MDLSMDGGSSFIVRFCMKFVRFLIYAINRHPYFHYEKLIKELQCSNIERKELECYLYTTSNRLKYYHIFQIIMGFIIIFRSTITMLYLISIGRSDQDLTFIKVDDIYYRYKCFITNCSNFEDIDKLPYLKVCHPKITSAYDPSIDYDPLCLLYSVQLPISFFNHLVLPVLSLMMDPCATETSHFMEAPNLTLEITRKKIRRIMIDFYTSLMNFRYNYHQRLYEDSRRRKPIIDRARKRRSGSIVSRMGSVAGQYQGSNKEIENLLKLSYSYKSLDKNTFECINSCIPQSRSLWWQRKNIMIYLLMIFLTFLSLGGMFTFLFTFFRDNHIAHRIEFEKIKKHMTQNRCSIWTNHSGTLSLLDLDASNLRYSSSEGLWFFMMCAPLITAVATQIGILYVSFVELDLTLAEFRVNRILTDRMASIYSFNHISDEKSIEGSRLKVFTSAINYLIKNNRSYSPFLGETTISLEHQDNIIDPNTRLGFDMESQSFTLKILNGSPPSSELMISILERLYFRQRILFDIFRSNSTVIASMANLSNFDLYALCINILIINQLYGSSSSLSLFKLVSIAALGATVSKYPVAKIESRVSRNLLVSISSMNFN